MQRRELLKWLGVSAASATLAQAGGLEKPLPRPLPAAPQGFRKPSAERPLLLNFNENNLGMAPSARAAVVDALSHGNRYPDDENDALTAQIAQKFGFKPENVSLGTGSSQCINSVIYACVHRSRQAGRQVQVVAPDPTYSIGEVVAGSLNVPVAKVPLNARMEADLGALQQACEAFDGDSIVYLCNPNNPTATVVSSAELEKWVLSAPESTFFLIDEAYWDFVVDPRFFTAARWVKAGRQNVAVVRTFSKLYALAGLRVGYTLATSELITKFEAFQSLDNMNLAGLVAASASLADQAFVSRSLASVAESRRIVTRALDELGLKYASSNGNFILHEIRGTVPAYRDAMNKRFHIKVGRDFAPYTTWSRLTLGTPEEMRYFVECFKQVMSS